VPDVVLPVLNEAGAIPLVLSAMPPGYRPIVVDNGSSDGSGAIARRLGAEVVTEPVLGFGAACYAGLRAATADIVCFMDCDGSLDPADLPPVVGPIERREADLVVGERLPERGAWPAHARLANRALAIRVGRRTGLALRDLGPMRAAPRAALLSLDLRDRGFGWPLEMVLKAAGAGWRVVGVPVPYAARTGRSKVTGTVRGTIVAVRDMARILA
jgi:glycosyltransferase involved in cell wall biosynthesis